MSSPDLAKTEFMAEFRVSRETIDRLDRFEALVRKWNPVINLVARSTLGDIWHRHFRDSGEVLKIAPPGVKRWVDLGSGGGFPALVISILAKELDPNLSMTCIESDIRKCEFLRSVGRELGLKLSVLSRRVEDAPPQSADVITARAVAPLDKLLGLAQRHLAPDGTAILHKGESYQTEVDTALENWSFAMTKHDNPTKPGSVLLAIKDISRG